MKMENNLSKAISQIITKWCEGATDNIADGVLYHHAAEEIAEMINGLDGRGNLQEGDQPEDWYEYFQSILGLAISVADTFYYWGRDKKYVDIPNDVAEMFDTGFFDVPKYPKQEAPDRQVKSAEDVFQSKNGGKDSDTSVEHGETFTAKFVIDMMEIYAQQYK